MILRDIPSIFPAAHRIGILVHKPSTALCTATRHPPPQACWSGDPSAHGSGHAVGGGAAGQHPPRQHGCRRPSRLRRLIDGVSGWGLGPRRGRALRCQAGRRRPPWRACPVRPVCLTGPADPADPALTAGTGAGARRETTSMLHCPRLLWRQRCSIDVVSRGSPGAAGAGLEMPGGAGGEGGAPGGGGGAMEGDAGAAAHDHDRRGGS
jgi:hypothetical protein